MNNPYVDTNLLSSPSENKKYIQQHSVRNDDDEKNGYNECTEGQTANDIDPGKVMANNKAEMFKWDEDDVGEFIKFLSRKYEDIDADIADKFEDEEIEGKDLWVITKKELKKKVGIEDKDAKKKIFEELTQIREGKIRLLPIKEYEAKIKKWDKDMVEAYIGSIYDGKYSKYMDNFKGVNGKIILNEIVSSQVLKTKYGIVDGADRSDIWKKINLLRINQNIPSEDELYHKFKTVQKALKKEIEDWDEKMVQMFIATASDGTFYEYHTKFVKVTGKDLLDKFVAADILLKYGIENGGVRYDLNEKIQQMRNNVDVPDKKKLYDDFERIKKEKDSKKLNLTGVNVVRLMKKPKVGKPNRTLMVIGATGTGKTTMLNSMMNYLYEVKYEYPYRFKLIVEKKKEHGQAESQTDDVTAYYLECPALPFQLTLIDTPGYGDTRGIQQDEKITKQIKKFFETKVSSIDAICFVIRAPQARLTPTQKYIFAQVLSIFGKDIAENILVLMTFADGKKPPAMEALKAGKVPFRKHFKLNNSAFDLPEDDEDDVFSKTFWKMGMNAFGKLFDEVALLKTKSLQLTRQVLTQRETLENYIVSVQPTIKAGFTVLDKLRQQINLINKFGDVLDANKDFEYQEKVMKVRKDHNGARGNTTTCLNCNYTCHNGCVYSDNADKKGCYAMQGTENCTICPQKCHWSIHKNLPYTFVWYEETVTKTTAAMKAKYLDSSSKKSNSEQMMAGTLAEFDATQVALNGLISGVKDCLNQLSKIALRPNVLSQDDYIDKLIQSEESEKKPGYKNRVRALQGLKEKQEILNKVNAANYNPFAQYNDVAQFVKKNENVKKTFKNKVSKKKNSRGKPRKYAIYDPRGWF